MIQVVMTVAPNSNVRLRGSENDAVAICETKPTHHPTDGETPGE